MILMAKNLKITLHHGIVNRTLLSAPPSRPSASTRSVRPLSARTPRPIKVWVNAVRHLVTVEEVD